MSVEKRNLLLTDITEHQDYISKPGRGKEKKIPERDYIAHAKSVHKKFDSMINGSLTQKQIATKKMKGVYAEFSGKKDYELVTKSLEYRPSGIRLLNVQISEDGCTKATVFIPEGKEDYFYKRINQYAHEKTKKGNPKNSDLIGSIEDIQSAILESFWTDKIDKLPGTNSTNCEIWLRYDESKNLLNNDVEKQFHDLCEKLGIPVAKDMKLVFPERIVKMITTNREQLNAIITECEYVTEIRRAEEATSFFISQEKKDQSLWKEDILSRCSFNDSDISICILDAGINNHHPLLKPAILENGVHTINPDWGTEDNSIQNGHGTEMAGISLYGNLQEALESTEHIDLNHKIESVKILPKQGINHRSLYGAITQNAVALAEIENPKTKRLFCMALTSPETPNQNGWPTSWSAALDEIASGATEEGQNQRLFLVSAGNVNPSSFREFVYPDRNSIESVQNPAQAWNAVSVGGYAGKVEIHDLSFLGFQALAEIEALSPYSTTSASWNGSWPIKPEVLFDAGNVATNGSDYDSCDDLSLLTTGHRLGVNLFSTIWATSAATAQAANFCAKLYSEYPDLWPETIRALMIHSASWTDKMHEQFCPKGNNTSKTQRKNLVRHCGYGIPNLSKAIQCFNNSVNMIVQGEIQPFKKVGSRATMNEMQIHSFPWPSELLRSLGEIEVKLKVTLSYFIEPSPGEIGWKDRYRYPSCGLRFEVNRANQTRDDFIHQISKLMSDNEANDGESTNRSGNDWYLGVKTHGYGSLHSDFLVANAVDLCESKYIAVYPVGGWWKERVYLGKCEERIRYSLVVSISTPELNVDLYTPIVNQIKTQVPVEVSIS